jgi:hypothetical protein
MHMLLPGSAGTSVGVLGVGGYCTGTIVAVGAASTLHPTGKALLGYPCVEHIGRVLDMLPIISNTQKGKPAPCQSRVKLLNQ